MSTTRPVWLEQPDALALPPPAPALRLAIGRDIARLFRAANGTYQPERDYALHHAPSATRARLTVSDPSAQANVWRQWEIGEIGAPVDAHTLQLATLPPSLPVIAGLIPRGLTILAGAPGAGKSWIAAALALSVARGEPWYALSTGTAAPVLCCFLEDTYARAKGRIAVLTAAAPPTLHVATALEGEADIEALTRWIEQIQPRLVILDTLQRWRGSRPGGYRADYTDAGKLKKLADAHDLALLVIHHTTKSFKPDNLLGAVAGSAGLTGAADCVLVLYRQQQTARGFIAVAKARDLPERVYPLSFVNGQWTPANVPQIGRTEPRRIAHANSP